MRNSANCAVYSNFWKSCHLLLRTCTDTWVFSQLSFCANAVETWFLLAKWQKRLSVLYLQCESLAIISILPRSWIVELHIIDHTYCPKFSPLLQLVYYHYYYFAFHWWIYHLHLFSFRWWWIFICFPLKIWEFFIENYSDVTLLKCFNYF
jgi:hypothetical protein